MADPHSLASPSDPVGPDGTIVVVGASLAGLRAAEELRHERHGGPVIVVGDEPHAPYDRPPLSKQLLAGTWDEERVHHHAPDKLDTLGIEFRLGLRADSLDVSGRQVHLADGSSLDFDGLIIATGARARRLPGTDGVDGVFVLRTLDDCLALRSRLDQFGDAAGGDAARVVVIGAGFIGAEVAATCHGRGARVTVVEALETPLANVLGVEMGAACAGLHADNGVELRTGAGVAGIDAGADDPVTVTLTDGTVLPADVVVVGIGVTPATDWLEGSGLTVSDGVVCNESLFAAPRIVAAGDVARWWHRGLDQELRIEHWTNATESGPRAARNLLAGSAAATAYEPVPFFWSDQYGVKIQMVGRPDPSDDVVVVDGSVEERRLIALYRRGDRLSAALAFSRPRQLMGYRPLVEAGASFDDALALARS